jgi:two-component system chemotaxis response regulator CheY
MAKILVVDDSMFTRNIHKQIISEILDCQIFEAGSGTEAIAIYQKEQPDLVLMDLLMPDMDGLDVTRALITNEKNARIIICSTDKQKFRQQEAFEAGARAFVPKPVDPDVLKENIENVLKNRE